jgi:DNA-3-methyladenine glycosylase I
VSSISEIDQQEPAHPQQVSESANRCSWAAGDALMEAYHDREWGVPLHNDQLLFELLTLEGAQAGLTWLTVLRRRDGYRSAFAGFDIPTVAAFGQTEIKRLLQTASIVRNRQKVVSTVENARCVLEIQREYASFDRFLWSFVPNAIPIVRKPGLNPRAANCLARNRIVQQSIAQAGLSLRWADDLLRIHGGRGRGERSPGHLLSVFGAHIVVNACHSPGSACLSSLVIGTNRSRICEERGSLVMTTTVSDRVLELVVFKLHGGVTRDQFLPTADAVSEWAKQQPGFISRELCYAEAEDKWIEVVWWRTLHDAEAAAEAAVSSESCAPMFALIEMDQMQFLHGVPLATAVAA